MATEVSSALGPVCFHGEVVLVGVVHNTSFRPKKEVVGYLAAFRKVDARCPVAVHTCKFLALRLAMLFFLILFVPTAISRSSSW